MNNILETMQEQRLIDLHLDLLNKSRLAWDVIQEPIVTPSGRVTEQIGVFRSDNDLHLGTHSQRYTLCQNSELAKMVIYAASDIEDLNLDKMRGGQLQSGRKVYIQIELPPRQINGHEMRSWLTALNSHDGTTTLAFGSCKTLVVCQNTFYQAYRSPKMAKLMHNSTLQSRLESVAESMRESILMDRQIDRLFERMYDKPVKHDHVNVLKEAIFTPLDGKEESTRRKNATAKFHEAVDIEYATHGQNAWGLFNGVTRYTNHQMGLRKATDRISNVMVGTGAKINTMAFNYLTSLS